MRGRKYNRQPRQVAGVEERIIKMNSDNKVYFSRIGDCDKWIDNNDSGTMKILIFPRRWWSIKDWKFCIKFKKNFRSGFVTKN